MTRSELAKAAFNGQNKALAEYIMQENGYEMDGVKYPANGMSEQDALDFMLSISPAHFEMLEMMEII